MGLTELAPGNLWNTMPCHTHERRMEVKFYYNCAPAHTTYPTKKVTPDEVSPVTLGDNLTSNRRTINKYFVPDVLETCQLSMGLTELAPGNLWNTMPCHTHERRMEVYFYFNMDDDACVFHMMGQPQETRHIVMHNEQAVISPSWSIHSGVGTKAYTFIWGMVGENQVSAFSLEGKVAVVTGCDTGLGQGMALGLAQAGCDIVGINIVEPTETIKQVTAQGRRFLSLTANLRKIDGIPALLDRAVAEFGHIDILVNNAGLIRREDALEFSETDWDDVMNLNIKSVFFMSQAAAKTSLNRLKPSSRSRRRGVVF